MPTGRRPPKIGEEHWEVLRAIVAERPTGTLAEIAAELQLRVGIEAHPATIRKALREAGSARVREGEGTRRVERGKAMVTLKRIVAGIPTRTTPAR